MRRALTAFLVGLAVWSVAGSARPEETGPADLGFVEADTGLAFTVEIGNRLYPEWKETQEVGLQETFYLGDTPYTARLTAFAPDFRMSSDGSPINVSREMGNPAVHVYVYADTGAVDSSWAFLNFPPHFSPRSFFKFQLVEIHGYEPATAADED